MTKYKTCPLCRRMHESKKNKYCPACKPMMDAVRKMKHSIKLRTQLIKFIKRFYYLQIKKELYHKATKELKQMKTEELINKVRQQ